MEELQPLEFVGLCIIERINPWSAWLEHLAVSVDMETVKRKRIILAFSMETTNEAVWGCSGYILIVKLRL